MEEPRQGAKAERDIEDSDPLEPPPKKTRGRPVTRVLPLPTSKEFTPGCSGCLGTSYKHSKFCKERNKDFFERMEIEKLATKVQRDEERELLRSIERAEKASKVQPGASAAAASSGSRPSSSTEPPQPPSGDAGAMDASHIYNSEVNGIFDTIRHPDNFTKDFIQEVFTKYHTVCHVNEEEHFMKDLLDDPNEVDFGDHLDYDEDDGEALDPGQVKEGIQRELDMMRDLDVGEPVRRDEIAKGTKIWTTRWCHRKKAGGVRARLVVRQVDRRQVRRQLRPYARHRRHPASHSRRVSRGRRIHHG